MTHAAKLVWNLNHWEFPSGVAKNGVNVGNYLYGLEEWLNNKTLRSEKIGYLDCYRASKFNDIRDIILLTFDPNNREVYHIGNIFGVFQLNNTAINNIRHRLNILNFKSSVKEDFIRIENIQNPRGFTLYSINNWNSTSIISSPPAGFFVNIGYDSIIIFDNQDWVSLTKIDRKINSVWKYLGRRYQLENLGFTNSLKQYFKSIIY
jgi:hypothetical protein